MKFYAYHQNNSAGWFDLDEDAGIGRLVWVEAASAADADRRAQELGLYFDGTSTGKDCPCCGSRWYRASDDDADSLPTYYGDKVHTGQKGTMPEPDGFVHYMDGSVDDAQVVSY